MRRNRRNLLKGIGAASVASPLAVMKARGEQRDEVQLIGLSYDPLTFERQRGVNGTLDRTSDGLTGRINVGGFNFELESPNNLGTAPTGGKKYGTVRHSEQFTRDGVPLGLEFTLDYGWVSGRLRRPSNEFSSIAFVASTNKQDSRKSVEKSLPAPRIPRGSSSRIDPPSKGVPKNTALSALIQGGNHE